jgi:hypothetical protein
VFFLREAPGGWTFTGAAVSPRWLRQARSVFTGLAATGMIFRDGCSVIPPTADLGIRVAVSRLRGAGRRSRR